MRVGSIELLGIIAFVASRGGIGEWMLVLGKGFDRLVDDLAGLRVGYRFLVAVVESVDDPCEVHPDAGLAMEVIAPYCFIPWAASRRATYLDAQFLVNREGF